MASVNKTILLGRVGKTPEQKQLQSGNSLTTFPLATHEVWRDKSGEKKEDLQWHNVVVWGKQAENVAKYVNKGDLIYIEGKIQTDQYEKNGQKLYATKIVAKDVKFLTPKGGGSGQPQQQQAQRTQPQFPPAQPQQAPQGPPPSMDDIPW